MFTLRRNVTILGVTAPTAAVPNFTQTDPLKTEGAARAVLSGIISIRKFFIPSSAN